MKLHLPSGLRKALLACLAALSVALPPTLGSASGIAAAFAALSVLAPQQVAAAEFTVHNHNDWASLFGNVDGVGDNSAANAADRTVTIHQDSTDKSDSIYFRDSDDTVSANLKFETDLSLNEGYSNNNRTYTFSGAFTGDGSFKLTGNIHHQHYVFTGNLSGWGGNFEITGGAGGDIIEFSGADFKSSHGSIILTANNPAESTHNPGPSRLIVDGVTLDNSSIQAGELQLKQAVIFSGGFEHGGQTVTITGETTFDTGSSLTLGTGANVTLTTVAAAGNTLTSLTMDEGTSLTVGSVAAAAARVAAAAASTTEMTVSALTLNGAAAITLGDGVKLTAAGVSGDGSLSTLTLGANAELILGGSGSLSLTGAFTYGTGAQLKLTGQITIDLSEGGSLVAAAGGQKLTIDLSQDLLGQIANGKYHLFEGLSDEQRDLFTFTVGGQEADATHTNLRLDANGDVVWGAEYTWNGNDATVALNGDPFTANDQHWDKDGTLDENSAVTLNGTNVSEVTVNVGDGATMLTLTLTGSPTNYKFGGVDKTLTVKGTLTVEKSASFEGNLGVTAGKVIVGAEGAPGHLKFSGQGAVDFYTDGGGGLTLRGDGTTVEVGATTGTSGGIMKFGHIDLGEGTSLVLKGEQAAGHDVQHGWETNNNPGLASGAGSIVLEGLGEHTQDKQGTGILWAFTKSSEDVDQIGHLRLRTDQARHAGTLLKCTGEMGTQGGHGLGSFVNVWVEAGSSLRDAAGILGTKKHADNLLHLSGNGIGDQDSNYATKQSDYDGALVLAAADKGIEWDIQAEANTTISVKENVTLHGTLTTQSYVLTIKTATNKTAKLTSTLNVGGGTLALTGDGTVELGTDGDKTFSASGSGTITVGANTTLKNAQATGGSLDMGSLTVSMNGGTLDVGANGMTLSNLEGDTGTINSTATGALTLKDGEGEFKGTVSSALNYNADGGSYTVATFSGSDALDVQAGALTVTTLTASNGNDVKVGTDTTLTVTELSAGSKLGTLTLNGRLELKKGKLDVTSLAVGTDGEHTIHIKMLDNNADSTTFANGLLDGSTVTGGQAKLEVDLEDILALTQTDDTHKKYHLFGDANSGSQLTEDQVSKFEELFGLTIVENSDNYSSNDCNRWEWELDQEGYLTFTKDETPQQWLEGDTAFTWKDADGEPYNKWTVGGAPEQVFSSEQNVEFAGTSTDPITVTVEGEINIARHDMEVRQGEGVQGTQSYTFVLESAGDKLTVGELSVGQGVTTDFNVGSGSVTASATVVDGTLVLSGSGTRNFGDVMVNDGASVWVKQGGNVSGKVHGGGTLYFDWTDATGQQTETAFRSLVAVEEGHTLEKAEIVTGTSLELSEAESAAPLGRVKNLTVETGANLTVSSADAIAGANPSVHLAGAGVNNSGALAVTAQGTVSMDWGITLDANASVSVGSGSTLQYGGKLDFGMAAEGQENNRLTKTGAGTLELSGNYAQGGAAGNFDVRQGTLKFSYTKSPDIEADGTVALADGATLESTITGTLGTLSGSGALKVSGGELTVKDLSGATLRNVEFSNGGKLHVGTNTLTGGGTLTVGAGGGTLDIVLTGDGVTDDVVNGGNILNFSALEQTGGGKVTLHLTGYEQFYNSSSIESDEQFTASLPPSYQLFEAENFKKLWKALNVGSDEGWWKPYFDIEVEITNRLIPELSTDGLLTFTKDVGFVWKGGGDNTWSAGNAGHTEDTHWVESKAPESDDNVTFAGEGQGEVLLDGDVKAKDVWVEKGDYTFTGKKDDVKDSLTVTDGDLVVQKDASLNLNVELKGVRKDTLVVLQGDDKARGTLNVQEGGELGENTHVKFEGGQLKYDSSSTAEDLSDKVLADESTSGVRVFVEGAGAKGTTWGNTVSGPAGGVRLALEKGIEKSGDGQFTLRWKDSVTSETVYRGPITVTDGKLTLDVTAEFPHSKSKLSGDVRLDGELDVSARTQTQLATPETTVELSGAVSGKGTLKATSGQVGLTGDLSKFSGSLAADGAGTCLVLSGNAVAGGTVGAAVSGNGGTVAVDGGDADVTLTGKVSGKDLTLRNDGSGELFVTSREPGNGSGTKLDGGKGGITLGSATSAVTWAGSQVTGGDITLSNVTLGQGGFTGGKGSGRIFVDTAPVPTSEVAPVAAANPQGGIVDVNGMNIGTFDGIAVNGYGTLRGLNGGSYTVGAEKALSLFFTPQNAENNTWSETAAEPKGQALVQGSGFTVELAAGNATANGLQLAFDYSVIRWFREHNSLYVRALDGGTWTHEGTVLDWMKMTDNVAQLMQVIVGTNYTFTDDGLQMNGSAKDLYVVMDDAENSDPEHSVTPEDLREKRATVVLDGKTLTLDWNGATVKDAPDGRIPNLLGGDEGTRLVIRNTADSSKTTTNRLEVEVDNTLREVRDGRFEDENGVPHLPEADGTHVQGEDTTFLGSITGELGVDLTKSGKGTLTVGGNYSMAEGTTKLKEGALVLRGGTNELRDLEFAYTTAQDTENNEKRRGLEVTDGGKTTVSGVIKESNEGGFSGDISVTQGAELVLQGESTLQSTGITGDNSGTLTLDGEASLTLAGDGKPDDPQLSGITVQVGANATLDTGRDQSELTALNGNGTLESNEGGKVTVHGGSFSGTLAPSPSADGGNPNAGTLKVADGASFTFDNAKSAAGSSEDPGAWDVELGEGVNLTVKVDKKSGSDSDRFTLGHITLGGNNLTVDFGAKAIGENYFAATLADIKSGSLTFNSDGMVKGNTHVDTGVSLAEGDQAAWNAFKDHVHFTGAGNFLTEQNVHTEGGKVIIDYSEATDNKLLGERGIPGAGKNGRAGAGMVWDSLKDKSQSQAFFDALMNPGSDFYRMGNDLIQMYDSGDTAGMERVLTSVAGASIATLGPALAQDIHRQLKSIRNRSTSMSVEKDADEFNSTLIRHAWINGESGYYKLEEDGYLPGFTLNSWGGTVGVDMNVSSNTVFALAVSAMYGDLKPHAAETADGSLDTTWLSGVVHTTRGPWIHTFVLSGGLADAEINRTVNYGSGSYRTSGSTDGYAVGVLYEVGYTHLLNKEGRSALQPIANIEWRHVSLDGYTENGSDAGLSVNKISQDIVTLGAGARLQTIVGANWVNHATLLETRALVKADIGDRSGTAENALVGMGNKGRGEVETAEVGSVGIEVGAGVTVPLGPRSGSIFADASVEWRSGWTAFDATVGYKISF